MLYVSFKQLRVEFCFQSNLRHVLYQKVQSIYMSRVRTDNSVLCLSGDAVCLSRGIFFTLHLHGSSPLFHARFHLQKKRTVWTVHSEGLAKILKAAPPSLRHTAMSRGFPFLCSSDCHSCPHLPLPSHLLTAFPYPPPVFFSFFQSLLL